MSSTDTTKNILIFGQTGVGKSSLVNLIIGEDLAHTSFGAASCTLHSESYFVDLGSHHFQIYDTVGLEEPQLSANEFLTAAEKASKLVNSLKIAGGIHLLLFCIAGGRITVTTQQNYRLFHEFFCGGEVPVVLVITHMENEDPMEGWWTKKEKEFKRCGIKITDHACVVTTRGIHGMYEDQYQESQEKVRELLQRHGMGDPFWMKAQTWIMRVLGFLGRLIGVIPPYNTREQVIRNLVGRCGISKEESEELASQAGFLEQAVGFGRWFMSGFKWPC